MVCCCDVPEPLADVPDIGDDDLLVGALGLNPLGDPLEGSHDAIHSLLCSTQAIGLTHLEVRQAHDQSPGTGLIRLRGHREDRPIEHLLKFLIGGLPDVLGYCDSGVVGNALVGAILKPDGPPALRDGVDRDVEELVPVLLDREPERLLESLLVPPDGGLVDVEHSTQCNVRHALPARLLRLLQDGPVDLLVQVVLQVARHQSSSSPEACLKRLANLL